MKNPHTLKTITTGLALGAILCGVSHAAIIALEDFDYETGALAGNNGGTGFGGAWTAIGTANNTVVTPGLSISVTGYTNSSGATNATGNSSSFTYNVRPFQTTVPTADGTSYWFSMLVNIATIDSNNRLIRVFNTAGASNVGFGINASDGGGGMTAGINNNNGTHFESLAYTLGVTQLLVGKVSFSDSAGADRMDVWLFNGGDDVTSLTDASASTSFVTGDVTTDQQGIAIGRGDTLGLYALDTFRLGTTVGSVMIPEPTVALLGGLGLLGLLRRRRG